MLKTGQDMFRRLRVGTVGTQERRPHVLNHKDVSLGLSADAELDDVFVIHGDRLCIAR